MQSFNQLIAALLFLVSFAFAQESVHTYYTTRTVYRVVTETQIGTAPTTVADVVTEISLGTIVPTLPASQTTIATPTHGTPSPTNGEPPMQTTNAAAALQVPAGIAAAAVMAMFAL